MPFMKIWKQTQGNREIFIKSAFLIETENCFQIAGNRFTISLTIFQNGSQSGFSVLAIIVISLPDNAEFAAIRIEHHSEKFIFPETAARQKSNLRPVNRFLAEKFIPQISVNKIVPNICIITAVRNILKLQHLTGRKPCQHRIVQNDISTAGFGLIIQSFQKIGAEGVVRIHKIDIFTTGLRQTFIPCGGNALIFLPDIFETCIAGSKLLADNLRVIR